VSRARFREVSGVVRWCQWESRVTRGRVTMGNEGIRQGVMRKS